MMDEIFNSSSKLKGLLNGKEGVSVKFKKDSSIISNTFVFIELKRLCLRVLGITSCAGFQQALKDF